MPTDLRIDELLVRVNAGDRGAWRQLLDETYRDLRRQAHAVTLGRTDITAATSILHDALLRLLEIDLSTVAFTGRGRYFAYVYRVIRNTMLDHLRGTGPVRFVPNPKLNDLPAMLRHADWFDLHLVLERLRTLDESLWTLVELRFIGCCTIEEIAQLTGSSLSTVERDWRFARAWLQRQMGGARDAARATTASA